MFKQILKFFQQKNNSEPSPIAQTKELPLAQLKHNLALLKEREAKYGDEVPVDLMNQIEDHCLAIHLIEQVRRGEISETEWEQSIQPLQVTAGLSSSNQQKSSFLENNPQSLATVRTELAVLKSTHARQAEYLPSLAGSAKVGAISLLQHTEQLIAELEEELLHISSAPSPQMLEAMALKILMARQRLSVLVQRNIHQGNLEHLEKQVAPESQFSKEALQMLLEPGMEQLQAQIRLLVEKSFLTGCLKIRDSLSTVKTA